MSGAVEVILKNAERLENWGESGDSREQITPTTPIDYRVWSALQIGSIDSGRAP